MAEGNKKSHKILIVDDEPFNCRILKLKLENAGYNVVTASNGEEGLSKFMVECPDVVISDIRMPRMNGYEMCKCIKEVSNGRPYLTIVITSTVEKRERSFVNEIENAVLLEKPISPGHLLTIVEDYFNKPSFV
jgi:CheY-like chemotaxis protein